jgi:hypothetical protein
MIGTLQGTSVLRLIRNSKGGLDFAAVCRELGWDPDDYSSYYVRAKLDQLERVALVVRDNQDRYRVADNWSDIQTALDISLTQAAALGPRSLIVEPLLGPPDTLSEPPDVFVIMPFDASLTRVWHEHIKSVTDNLGLSASRADDFFTSHAVMTDVWNALYSARVVVADCTRRNPNVFYEIGLAHVVGKQVILITQNRKDIPFDLLQYRYIVYHVTTDGLREFEERLTKTLVEILRS